MGEQLLPFKQIRLAQGLWSGCGRTQEKAIRSHLISPYTTLHLLIPIVMVYVMVMQIRIDFKNVIISDELLQQCLQSKLDGLSAANQIRF